MCHCTDQPPTTATSDVWRRTVLDLDLENNPDVECTDEEPRAFYQGDQKTEIWREDILKTIEDKIAEVDGELRALSLDIHAHPELGYEEYYAHKAYTDFMSKHGWTVEKSFLLETAWKATFERMSPNAEAGGVYRTVGVNSEMDALKGIGHACGHNLIGIAGVAVALAIRAAMEKHDLSGKVVLLGTPAEEGGSGKVALLEKGGYEGMHVCLMCHPAPGPVGSVSLSSSLAIERITVEYFGRTAHAALSPWEGRNALDAAVLGYNNISALRQQLRTTHRVHGVFEGKDWAPNIIPDYAKFISYVRAPTRKELEETVKRVLPCFEAAGLATGCKVKITLTSSVYELRQNKALGEEVANVVLNKYGRIDYIWGIKSASTDFGNVTYALPSLHPGFAIPTIPDGGNHTSGFEQSAATLAAHKVCLDVGKALAVTGVRVLVDDVFYGRVKATFEEEMRGA